jgi:hypothetical protein
LTEFKHSDRKDGPNLKHRRNAMIEQIPCAGLNALDNRVLLASIFHLKHSKRKQPANKNPARELVFRTSEAGSDPTTRGSVQHANTNFVCTLLNTPLQPLTAPRPDAPTDKAQSRRASVNLIL